MMKKRQHPIQFRATLFTVTACAVMVITATAFAAGSSLFNGKDPMNVDDYLTEVSNSLPTGSVDDAGKAFLDPDHRVYELASVVALGSPTDHVSPEGDYFGFDDTEKREDSNGAHRSSVNLPFPEFSSRRGMAFPFGVASAVGKQYESGQSASNMVEYRAAVANFNEGSEGSRVRQIGIGRIVKKAGDKADVDNGKTEFKYFNLPWDDGFAYLKIDGKKDSQRPHVATDMCAVETAGSNDGAFVIGEAIFRDELSGEWPSEYQPRLTIVDGYVYDRYDSGDTLDSYFDGDYVFFYYPDKNSPPSKYSAQNSRFHAVRVAAGDFDGDGVRNEFAAAFGWQDKDGNYGFSVSVYQIEEFSSEKSTLPKRLKVLVGDAVSGYYHVYSGHNKGNNGFDLAVGDFDGDGKDDLAVVTAMAHNSTLSTQGYARLFLYKGDRDKGLVFQKDWHSTDSDYEIDYYGSIVAEAGDLDGDGKDEIVAAAPIDHSSGEKYSMALMAWSAKDLSNPQLKAYIHTDYEIAKNADDYGNGFMPANAALAVAPVGGKLNPKTGLVCSDVIVNVRKQTNTKFNNTSLYVHHSRHDASGALNGLSSPSAEGGHKIGSNSYTGYYPILLAGDFAKESLILGDPEHWVFQGHENFTHIIMAPPHHVDYMRAAGAVDEPWAIRNFTFLEGMYSSYQSTNIEEKGTSIQLSPSLTLQAGLTEKAKGGIPFLLEGSETISVTAALSAAYDYADKENNYKSNETMLKADKDDVLVSYGADFHIWRYPLLGSAYPYDAQGGLLHDRTQFLQYLVPFDMMTSTYSSGSEADNYTPLHENGNLFSYPTAMSGTKGYEPPDPNEKGEWSTLKLASGGQEYGYGANARNTLTWRTTDTTSNTLTLNGNLGLSLSLSGEGKIPFVAKGSIGMSFSTAAAMKYVQGWTSTLSTSNVFVFNSVEPSAQAGSDMKNNAAFFYIPEVFKESGSGTVQFAYATKFSQGGTNRDNYWQSPTSPYNISSDLALNLPGKFVRVATASTIDRPTFRANGEDNATRIRGAVIAWTDGDKAGENCGRLLELGKAYDIIVPVANYSFVKSDATTVAFDLCKLDSNGNLTTVAHIGDAELPPLPGWQADSGGSHIEHNKTRVTYRWTVPDNITESGKYRIYVTIDPDDKISEVHENWNATGDPGGNNRGYIDSVGIAVSGSVSSASATETGIETARLYRAEEYTSKAASVKAEAPNVKVEITNMTPQEFWDEFRAGGRPHIEGTIAYTGTQKLTNVYVTVVDGEMKVRERNHILAKKHFGLIVPGESHTFAFTVRGAEYLTGDVISVYAHADGIPISDAPIHQWKWRESGESSDPIDPGGNTGGGSGCDVGFGTMTVLLCAALLHAKSKKSEKKQWETDAE
jgi:hypothetical protein